MLNKSFAVIFTLLLFSSTAFADFKGYLDIKMSAQNVETTSRQYIANGNLRSESKVNIPGMGEKKVTTIMKASNPDLVISIDEQNKTYSEINLKDLPMMQFEEDDEGEDEGEEAEVKVEKLGRGKVLGYNCDHVRIISEDQTTELWVTKDVLGFETFSEMTRQDEKQNEGLMKSLQVSGLNGFPLKMKEASTGMTWEVTKIKKQNVPASKFEVPAGYKKQSMPGMGSMSQEQRDQMQKMMEKMKAMKQN